MRKLEQLLVFPLVRTLFVLDHYLLQDCRVNLGDWIKGERTQREKECGSLPISCVLLVFRF